jgi:hypothetical protein
MGNRFGFRMHPSVALWHLLESCAYNEVAPPKETGHIKCGPPLIKYLANVVLEVEDQPLNYEVVANAFEGDPVKQVHAVVTSTVLPIPELLERDLRLRRRASKKQERRRAS